MPIRPFDLEKMTGHAPDKTQSNTEKILLKKYFNWKEINNK